jgi:ATP-dependent Lhr-like helicase
MNVLKEFHPAVRTWFERRFAAPTDAQSGGWPEIKAGRDTLISAPTGSGKTLAHSWSASTASSRRRTPGR